MSNIHTECRTTWNHVTRPWADQQRAHGRNQPWGFPPQPLDRQHELSSPGQRVATGVHRHRSGVIRLTGEGDRNARLSRDPGHDRYGTVQFLQDRPLLDVDFDVCPGSVGPFAGEQVVRVAAKFADRLAQADARRVRPVQIGGRECANQCAAAKKCCVKP